MCFHPPPASSRQSGYGSMYTTLLHSTQDNATPTAKQLQGTGPRVGRCCDGPSNLNFFYLVQPENKKVA